MSRRRNKIKTRAIEKASVASGISLSGPTRLIPDSVFVNPQDWHPEFTVPRPYANHAYVYACVRAIAQNISQVPFQVLTGPLNNPTAAPADGVSQASKLAKLFETPNFGMNQYQLWESTVTLLNLPGNAFWVLERTNTTQIPERIWVFGPECFIPVLSEDLMDLLGWVFVAPNGERLPLLTSEVLHFKFYNPYDMVFGMGPIEAARRGIKLDYLANEYGSSFFENSADPSGVIMSDKRMSKLQMQEIRDFWEARHRGPANAKRVGVLYGGMKYEPINISQKDMEFISQRSWVRDELLAVFKVPKTELSLFEDVNHATSLSQNRGFWEKTLIPIIRNIEAVISANFTVGLRTIVDRSLRLKFDIKSVAALQEQLNDKIANAEKLYKIGYPINMINEKLDLGMGKVEWGDTWYVNQALATIQDVISGEARQGAKPSHPTVDGPDGDTPPDGDGEAPENMPPNEEPEEPEEESYSRRRAIWKGVTSAQLARKKFLDTKAKELMEPLRGHLRRMRAKVLSSLVKTQSWACYDKNSLRAARLRRILPVAKEIGQQLGLSTFDICSELPNDIEFEVLVGRMLYFKLGSQTTDVTWAMGEVRTIFNELSTERNLYVLAQREVARVLRVAQMESNHELSQKTV